MLVLTRNADQSIVIGDDIVITVVSVDRGVVRLGITAPRQVAVHRGEVYADIAATGVRKKKGQQNR